MNTIKFVAAVILIALSVTPFAAAQSGTRKISWNITIPFAYHVGNQVMPLAIR